MVVWAWEVELGDGVNLAKICLVAICTSQSLSARYPVMRKRRDSSSRTKTHHSPDLGLDRVQRFLIIRVHPYLRCDFAQALRDVSLRQVLDLAPAQRRVAEMDKAGVEILL